jgi:hypothetical protein
MLPHTHTENIKHFEQRVVSKYTVQMLSGCAVAARHLPQDHTHAHLLHSLQGSSPGQWAIN